MTWKPLFATWPKTVKTLASVAAIVLAVRAVLLGLVACAGVIATASRIETKLDCLDTRVLRIENHLSKPVERVAVK